MTFFYLFLNLAATYSVNYGYIIDEAKIVQICISIKYKNDNDKYKKKKKMSKAASGKGSELFIVSEKYSCFLSYKMKNIEKRKF